MLSTLPLGHYPLRTAERAHMPETALLSALISFFCCQSVSLKLFCFLKLKCLLPLQILFFGNTTYYVDTASFRYLRNGPVFFFPNPFTFCTMIDAGSFHHNTRQRSQPNDLNLAHHMIVSSTPPSSGQQHCSPAS